MYLPRWRGAAPIQWAIASGDAETGVCLMQMDEGMDTGGVIDRAVLPIGPADTSASLHEALAALGGEVLRRSLRRYVDGELPVVPQPELGVTHARMIQKEDGRLDWSRSAAELERRLRAFTPWPGAFCASEVGALKVTAARVGDGRGAPGTVLTADARGVEVACQEGSLWLEVLQPEGKRAMPAKDFLQGRAVTVGAVW